jgi:hypothetical protein
MVREGCRCLEIMAADASRHFKGCPRREALPASDQPMPESGQPLDAYRGEGGSAEARGAFVSALQREGGVFVRCDAEGRVVRTPAIEALVVAARAVFAGRAFADDSGRWDVGAAELGDLVIALREVDREARSMGVNAAESRNFAGPPNDLAFGAVQGVRETRKPPITGASGAERDANPLAPADPGVEDRRCKK